MAVPQALARLGLGSWRVKAATQRFVARLPEGLSLPLYYLIQRRIGALRSFSPASRVDAACQIWTRVKASGTEPVDARFFEVGTGRAPIVPLVLWLLGARHTVTVDLNPYLCPRLTWRAARWIAENHDVVRAATDGCSIMAPRLEHLRRTVSGRERDFRLHDHLESCGIRYHAPADASNTGLGNGSVDVVVSYTVLEHVPLDAIRAIAVENRRILTRGGLAVHHIDYSDHFSHSDPSITEIHFLRYSDEEWDRIAGNRFMFMNRLRDTDFVREFSAAGFRILSHEPLMKPTLLALLKKDACALHARFRALHADTLATTRAWFCLRAT